MATAISQRVVPDGAPVWLLLEGQPSSGKTSMVNLLKGLSEKPDPLAVFVPKITIGSLTSGFKDSKSGKRAPALLKEFHTRCWCNTEFSTLLTGRPESVAPVLGVLTAAFDGDLSAAFGNVVEQGSPILRVESRFSLLGCITPKVRQDHAQLISKLGPRFLSYRLLPLTDDERQEAFRLVADPKRARHLKELEVLIADHVRCAFRDTTMVTVPEEANTVLQFLAQLVAAGRTPVEGWGEELTVGSGEDPIRVYQQLRSLTISLARVHGTPTPSPRALRLVRDVALSSFEPQRAEALVAQRTGPAVAFHYKQGGVPPLIWVHGMTVPQLVAETGWGEDKARNILRALSALGLYTLADRELVLVDKPPAGRASELYVPAPALNCVVNATFEAYPPSLITVPELVLAEPRKFKGHLSPPDARLATEAGFRRVEMRQQLREAGQRILMNRPELAGEELALLALGDVLEIPLASPTASDRGTAAS